MNFLNTPYGLMAVITWVKMRENLNNRERQTDSTPVDHFIYTRKAFVVNLNLISIIGDYFI